MAHYCADHDPLLLAGHLVCHRCGRAAYPTDAEWFGPRLVIATYPAPCAHHRAGETWLIDLDAPAQVRRWCGARTRTGNPCRQRARPDGSPCYAHRARSSS